MSGEQAAADRRRRWVPVVIACALFMENLDGTIINTSLPQMAADFGVSPLDLSGAVTAYLLSLAMFIPVSGWATDRFGARRVFMVAIAAFLAGSVVSGLAVSPLTLVVGRILQGMGGAMMAPVGRIVLLRTFSKAELLTAMAYVTTPALLGPAIGPLLGGLITTYSTWRLIFFVNVPFGLLGLWLAWKLFSDDRPVDAGRFDLPGFILAGGGLAVFVWGVESVGRGHMPGGWVAFLVSLGTLMLGFYGFYARRVPRAALELTPLKIPTFRMAVVGGLVVRIGFGGTPFLLPLFYQIGLGMSAMQSGAYTFMVGVGALTMKFVAGRMIKRWGFRRILMVNGSVIGSITLLFCLYDAATPAWLMLTTLGIFGFMRSLQFTAMNALGFADIPPQKAPAASALSAVSQQISVALGVALIASLLALLGNGTPDISDFHWAFIISAILPALSCLVFARMPPDAGAAVSGRRE